MHHAMVSTAQAGEGPAQAPGLSPHRFCEPQWGKPEPFPLPCPGCQVSNEARAAGGAGHLPSISSQHREPDRLWRGRGKSPRLLLAAWGGEV